MALPLDGPGERRRQPASGVPGRCWAEAAASQGDRAPCPTEMPRAAPHGGTWRGMALAFLLAGLHTEDHHVPKMQTPERTMLSPRPESVWTPLAVTAPDNTGSSGAPLTHMGAVLPVLPANQETPASPATAPQKLSQHLCRCEALQESGHSPRHRLLRGAHSHQESSQGSPLSTPATMGAVVSRLRAHTQPGRTGRRPAQTHSPGATAEEDGPRPGPPP